MLTARSDWGANNSEIFIAVLKAYDEWNYELADCERVHLDVYEKKYAEIKARREHETKQQALEQKVRAAEIALKASRRARALANVRQHQKKLGRAKLGQGKIPASQRYLMVDDVEDEHGNIEMKPVQTSERARIANHSSARTCFMAT